MKKAFFIIVIMFAVWVIPTQAQSPALTFDYTSSPYTASPYNATYPTPSGYNVPTHTPGSGYRVTSSYLWDGYSNGNRSCVQHYYGGTFSSLTRFVIVTAGVNQRLFFSLYDSDGVNVYSQYWDQSSGTRDVSVTESDVRYSVICLSGAANINNNNLYIVSLALYGTFQLDGVSFDADPIEGGVPLTVTFTNTSICSEGDPGWEWDFDGDSVVDSTDEDPEPFTYSAVGTYFATLTAMCNGALDDHTEMITVNGTLTRPLAASDEFDPFGIWDKASYPDVVTNPFNAFSPDPYLVVAMSDNEHDMVYAVGEGTVLSIEPVGTSCFGLNNSLQAFCLLRFDGNSWDEEADTSADYFYTVDRQPLYRVEIGGDDGYRYEYIVENALNYLYVGLELSAGCILGETTAFTLPSAVILGFELPVNQPLAYGAFVSRLDGSGDRISLLPELVVEPDPGAACNAIPDEASCLTIADPANDQTWGINGSGTRLAYGGVELQPYAQLYTTVAFADGHAYGARVTVDRGDRPGNAISRLAVVVGSASEPSIDLTYQYGVYEVDPVAYDEADLPEVTITNLSTHPIRIERICVHDGTSDPRPDTCAFSNYSFDDGLTDWGYNEDITNGLAGGEIAAFDGGTFYQNLQLYPDGASAHTYRIYVKVHLLSEYISAYPAATLRLDYTYGTHTGYIPSPATSSTYAFSLWSGWAGREATFAVDLNISDVEEHNFYVAATISGASGAFVSVREICVDDPFDNGDYGGGLPPFYSPSCNLVTPPRDGDGVGTWTYFLWQSLDRFFQCDLMTALNRLINIGNTQLNYFRWSIRWNSAAISSSTEFFTNSVLPWLGGHLSNIASGRTTTIIENDQQCSDLFCLLDGLFNGLIGSVLGPLVDAVVNVVNVLLSLVDDVLSVALSLVIALFTLIFNIVTQLFGVFGTLVNYVVALFTGITNAQPVDLGMPRCDLDPRSTLWCYPSWLAENTIFSGTGGQLLYAILIGWLVWNVIEDLIEALINRISETTEAL